MDIAVGKRYRIINRATKEAAWFSPHELFERQGNTVVYGTLNAHGIYLPSTVGRRMVRERPSCFPVLAHARGGDVLKLMAQLKSLPLVLELAEPLNLDLVGGANPIQMAPGHYMPVLNVQRTVRKELTKDQMLGRACELIQVWQEWQRLGQVVPFWFRQMLQDEGKPPHLLAA